MAVLFAGITAAPASAQDYKEAYNSGLEAAKAKKYDDAYTHFVKAAQGAKAANDAEVQQRANKIMAQLDYNRGKKLSDAEKYDEALKHFEKGINHLPNFANNYLGKAVALKKLGRDEDAVQAYLDLVKVGEETNSSEAVRQGQNSIRDHFVFKASSALGRNTDPTRRDAEEALSHLEKLQEHVEADADTYFYMAAAHNALSNYDEAIALADKALELHRGSKSDKAKIFFVKGEALMYSGNVLAAKSAFQEATFGSYKSLAEHYLETL